MKKDDGRRLWQWLVREWLRPLLPVVLLLTAVRSAVADWNDVPTGSMNPAILEGDRVFINKLAYSLRFPLTRWHLWEFSSPQRGDIVVFVSPHDGKRLVKRVMGLAGDTLEMRANELWLNGAPLAYRPADRQLRAQLAPTMPVQWPVAVEELPGRPHPVLGKPQAPARRSFPPLTVPEGHVFVLGDSRDDSFDSRFLGPVDRTRILGEATHVVLSFDPEQYYLQRWRRTLTRLP